MVVQLFRNTTIAGNGCSSSLSAARCFLVEKRNRAHLRGASPTKMGTARRLFLGADPTELIVETSLGRINRHVVRDGDRDDFQVEGDVSLPEGEILVFRLEASVRVRLDTRCTAVQDRTAAFKPSIAIAQRGSGRLTGRKPSSHWRRVARMRSMKNRIHIFGRDKVRRAVEPDRPRTPSGPRPLMRI